MRVRYNINLDESSFGLFCHHTGVNVDNYKLLGSMRCEIKT